MSFNDLILQEFIWNESDNTTQATDGSQSSHYLGLTEDWCFHYAGCEVCKTEK